MSRNNKNAKSRREFWRKLVVWVLAVLMVLGMIVPTLSWILMTPASAAYYADTDDTIVRIGLLYGTSVVPAFQTRSPYGFNVCTVDRETNEVTELYKLSSTVLESTVEKNLKLELGDYVPTDGDCTIGAYHAMLDAPLTLDELYLAMYAAMGNGSTAQLIASYSNGSYYLLVGTFASAQSAQSYIDNAGDIFAGFEVDGEPVGELVVSTPSESAINLIDYESHRIVFRYDGGELEELGLTAVDAEDGTTAYLQTPANKLYDGVFIFTRSGDGVMLVNLIGLEDYVAGVLPYEISNSWPLETQKAFAVAVRSYTVNKLGRHKSAYGFDLCNTVCCQSYGGVRNVNDTVRTAVESTRGNVLVSAEGDIITTYYSAVAGGTTVSAQNAWGGAGESYLTAIATPWEDYSSHPNGTWKWSASPRELAELLISKGYTDIKGDIDDIELEYAEDSDYVYKIRFIDIYGNEATIKNTDTVRSKLSAYLKSANFVVGRGSVTVNDPAFGTDSSKKLFSRMNGSKIHYINWTDPLTLLNDSGITHSWAGVDTPVMTANGIAYVDRRTTIYADDTDDFIFVGRGWGHGVGLSQVGAYCLGVQGFDAEFILTSYFAGTHIEDYASIVERDI